MSMNLVGVDSLQRADLIEFDASQLPLTLSKKEAANMLGISTKTLDRFEKDGWIGARQRGLYGSKLYRTAEVLKMVGYKAVWNLNKEKNNGR